VHYRFIFYLLYLDYLLHISMYNAVYYLTSTEQPIMDSRSAALAMMLKRFGGGLWVRSNISVTPPVKSSIASLLEPPFRFS